MGVQPVAQLFPSDGSDQPVDLGGPESRPGRPRGEESPRACGLMSVNN